ncbi:MAG: SGNH/GDSL hydrolase family protein [Saprospiraceae bacterium]|nr:SGNH/GDSL hydrolase family protein [Saprospiraceae bacterium]MDB4769166.1 SGNH/GDSL hydrolase family protein [Saprospiraceae bacterium]MDG1435908.1 SGNH/GDSL hydrolase family protein [Saprospiraceae bacterium]MDG2418138.1 SGNH/GDSL hydrolase family protein [Saprospiraceae bacterium]
MINQFKYTFNIIYNLPLIPLIYFQGKRIKAKVPVLPDAAGSEGVEGQSDQQINLLTLGESSIAGVGVDFHKNGLTGALAQSLFQKYNYKINWKVVAKSGYTAKKVVKELIPQIGNFQPDIIVIGLGANDAFKFNSPRKWRANMNTLFTRLNNSFPNSKTVCINMPPIHEFPAFTPLMKRTIGNMVNLLGDELKDLTTKFDNVFFLEDKLTFESWMHKFDRPMQSSDFFSDGVHPSALTYQTWGRDVGDYIFENKILEHFKKKWQQLGQ